MKQIMFATNLIQVLTFGFTKLTVLLFYKRIFSGPLFMAAVWTMIGITCIWTTAFFFSELLQCFPLSVNWSEYGNAFDQCIDSNKMMIAQAWSDVMTNFLILSLPIASVRHECLRNFSRGTR